MSGRGYWSRRGARDLVVGILGEVRAEYEFALVGYVIMPEHVHLLVDERGFVSPAKIVQIFKQRVSRRVLESAKSCCTESEIRQVRRFWQRRYYDFNVYSGEKLREKLDYMHANPIVEGLVQDPKEWVWSSWSNYELGVGILRVDTV